MRILFAPLGILLLLVLPCSASAGTYRWTDAAGVLHFTDNPDTIPPNYLNRVKELPSAQAEQQVPSPTLTPPSPVPQTTGELPSPLNGGSEICDPGEEHARLGLELQKLQDGLPEKKKDLEKLRRRWNSLKGRIPTQKEKEEFARKQAEGEAGEKDNPFVNSTPPGFPGLAREEYFRKLEEVRKDEERIALLRKELDALNRKANLPGI